MLIQQRKNQLGRALPVASAVYMRRSSETRSSMSPQRERRAARRRVRLLRVQLVLVFAVQLHDPSSRLPTAQCLQDIQPQQQNDHVLCILYEQMVLSVHPSQSTQSSGIFTRRVKTTRSNINTLIQELVPIFYRNLLFCSCGYNHAEFPNPELNHLELHAKKGCKPSLSAALQAFQLNQVQASWYSC